MFTDFNVILLISYSFIITIFTLIIPLFSTFGFVSYEECNIHM